MLMDTRHYMEVSVVGQAGGAWSLGMGEAGLRSYYFWHSDRMGGWHAEVFPWAVILALVTTLLLYSQGPGRSYARLNVTWNSRRKMFLLTTRLQ